MKSLNKFYTKLLKNKGFVNRNTSHLNKFIISSEINEYDLFKLAQLNEIELEIGKGWNILVLELIKELNENGWDRKVTCIKEKYGSLRFYPENKFNGAGDYFGDIIDEYTAKSEETCETCGEHGELKDNNGILYTSCELHSRPPRQMP